MPTFIDAANEVLSYAARPASETDALSRAKTCINDAILFANRSHKFKYAEKAARFTYPANSLFVDIGSVCSGRVLGINTLQLLAASTDFYGIPAPIFSFQDVHQKRSNSYRSKVSTGLEYAASGKPDFTLASDLSFDQGVRASEGIRVFLLGQSIGVYKAPTNDIYFSMTYNALLDRLVNDTDTNFFLDMGYDFIVSKALQKFYRYQKDTQRAKDLQDQVDMDWQSILDWDTNCISSSAISD